MVTSSQRCKAAVQITFDTSTGTGSYLAFSAPLSNPPSLIIFDNQSSVPVTVSDDGTNDFKTFASGQAMILDLRTNRTDKSGDFSWSTHTQFYANCEAGSGLFLISYVYAL